MKRFKKRYRFIFWLNVAVVVVIIGYKMYLNINETVFSARNLDAYKQIQESLPEGEFSFAVLGNIESSINVFNNRIIPSLEYDPDIMFVVSAGNAVINGGEDKYRILHRAVGELDIPFVVAFGENEAVGNGMANFYSYFGPLYFSFEAGGAYFIFPDTTGCTPYEWQKDWLETEFAKASEYDCVFVFLSRPAYVPQDSSVFGFMDRTNAKDAEFAAFLRGVFEKYNVSAVFSTEQGVYSHSVVNGVQYYITGGGGGGLHIFDRDSVYHYLKVKVSGGEVDVQIIPQGGGDGPVLVRVFERMWISIHAFFYFNRTDFLLVLCLFILLAFFIQIKSSKEVSYYRNFSEDDERKGREKLTIAMFTNNYFPFIGGVPISISRLAKGLRKLGHTVYIFCPEYPEEYEDDEYIVRCPLLSYKKTKVFNFAFVNIFTKRIEEQFIKNDFDVIHAHHPFWMGKKGLEFGENYSLPVVLTYHTRFDSYYHYMPILKMFFKNYWSHWIVKSFSQRCNAIIAPAESSKEYLTNIGVSRHIEVLPTGVDVEAFKQVPSNERDEIARKYSPSGEMLFCTVSRLASEKNIFFLIEALEFCKAHTTVPFKCVIIGDGPERESIEEMVEKKALGDAVELIGNVPPARVAAFYSACELFLFASKTETQGMVIQEAMAGSCAVVAVASSGISDSLKDGYNGYITKEDITEFSRKIIELAENDELRERMKLNAESSAEGFSVEVMAVKAVDVYRAAIHHKKVFGTTFK